MFELATSVSGILSQDSFDHFSRSFDDSYPGVSVLYLTPNLLPGQESEPLRTLAV